jgi:hypothetical protein
VNRGAYPRNSLKLHLADASYRSVLIKLTDASYRSVLIKQSKINSKGACEYDNTKEIEVHCQSNEKVMVQVHKLGTFSTIYLVVH